MFIIHIFSFKNVVLIVPNHFEIQPVSGCRALFIYCISGEYAFQTAFTAVKK